jgi:hypothetical protein
VIRMTAPTTSAAANSTSAPSASPATSQPSRTATSGLTYAYVETAVGDATRSSQA